MRRHLVAFLASAVVLTSLPVTAAVADGHAVTDGAITSFDGTNITYTLFQPAGTDAANPVPMVLHSHGWGGARSTTGFTEWLDQGFGVLSFDQRGFGESGGEANVQDPEFEARDVGELIDLVAGLPWVALDAPGDPVLFAIGGSYGGGYQWVTALSEEAADGTRFNALAPEISWFDLTDSLAPSGVVRSLWVTLLYAAGAQALPAYVHQAFAYGATTGQWPDGTVPVVPNMQAEFFQHGPSGFVANGVQLDIPVLIRQGTTDTLFNLNQGFHNYLQTLTDDARDASLMVSYNGGHVLPAVTPAGTGGDGDPCSAASASGDFAQLTRDFFHAVADGGDPTTVLTAPINLATPDGQCIAVDALDHETVEVPGILGSTTGVGVTQHVAIADGPLTLAGIPTLDATVTSVGVDQRVLVALSVGTSTEDAAVVHNNLLPLRELLPVVGEAREDVELPAVGVIVPEGQTLFLTLTPIVDTYFAHGSIRTPGAILLEDISVDLPVPGEPEDGGDEGDDGPGRPDNPGRPDKPGRPDRPETASPWHAQVPEHA